MERGHYTVGHSAYEEPRGGCFAEELEGVAGDRGGGEEDDGVEAEVGPDYYFAERPPENAYTVDILYWKTNIKLSFQNNISN